MSVPNSVRSGLANALHRVRSPARLNSILELNKAIQNYERESKRMIELGNMARFHSTPGVWARFLAYQPGTRMSNSNFSFRRQLNRFNRASATRFNAYQRLMQRRLAVSRAFQNPNVAHMKLNGLRNFVKRYKPIAAGHVIARRVNRAAFDPATTLGRKRLQRELNKLMQN
jgi:hypothetical protein